MMGWEDLFIVVGGIWLATSGFTEALSAALHIRTERKPLLAALVTAVCVVLCVWPLEMIKLSNGSVGLKEILALFVLAAVLSVGSQAGHDKHVKPLNKLFNGWRKKGG